jgi:hypothetical protein
MQTASLLLGFYVTYRTLVESERSQRLQNLLELNKSYHSIWKTVLEQPGLGRVLEPVDIKLEPISLQEDIMVRQVINHLFVVYKALKFGQLDKLEGMDKDIQDFFMLPIPRAIWEKYKVYQDGAFRKFIESRLES